MGQRTHAVVSGYFNPLHLGHLRLLTAARELADGLVVIVNNDAQQVLKKGTVIMPESDRLEIVRALRVVDDALLSVDDDPTVVLSLQEVARRYPDDALVFANGGDRHSVKVVPETAICASLGIRMVFGVGGTTKTDSSTRINQATGHER